MKRIYAVLAVLALAAPLAGDASVVLSTQYQTVELIANLSASSGSPHWVVLP